MEELLGLLDEVKAYKRLLLLDTGFSGKLGESGRVALQASQTQGGSGQEGKRGILMKPSLWSRIKETKPLEEGVFERKGEHRGLIVIGSSGGAEQAWESDAAKNGVFSAAIIESMTKRTADVNEDGMVTALELASHVCDRVLKETRGKQAPVVWMSETGHDFALAPGV